MASVQTRGLATGAAECHVLSTCPLPFRCPLPFVGGRHPLPPQTSSKFHLSVTEEAEKKKIGISCRDTTRTREHRFTITRTAESLGAQQGDAREYCNMTVSGGLSNFIGDVQTVSSAITMQTSSNAFHANGFIDQYLTLT